MPPELRPIFRPMMTQMIVGWLVGMVGLGCYIYFVAVYYYGPNHHAPDDPPNAPIVVSIAITVTALVFTFIAMWKLLRAGLFLRWNWWRGRLDKRRKS